MTTYHVLEISKKANNDLTLVSTLLTNILPTVPTRLSQVSIISLYPSIPHIRIFYQIFKTYSVKQKQKQTNKKQGITKKFVKRFP